LFEGEEGVAEASVVDAEGVAERGPGAGFAGAAELGAHGIGEGLGLVVVVVELESGGLAVASGEAQQQGLGRGRGAVLDGEAEALVGLADEVAGGVGPGVEVGAAAQGLAGVAP